MTAYEGQKDGRSTRVFTVRLSAVLPTRPVVNFVMFKFKPGYHQHTNPTETSPMGRIFVCSCDKSRLLGSDSLYMRNNVYRVPAKDRKPFLS
jgi:hypothetical protein